MLCVMNAWRRLLGPLSHLSNHINPILHSAACKLGARRCMFMCGWVSVVIWFWGFLGVCLVLLLFPPQSLLHTVLRLAYIMQTHTPTPLMSRVLSWVKIRGRCACACMRACVVWLICLISVLWILLIPLLSTLPFISPRSIPPHPLTSIICSLALLLYLPHPAPRFLSSSPLLQRVFLPFFYSFYPPPIPSSPALQPIASPPLSSSISTGYSSYIFITSTPPPLTATFSSQSACWVCRQGLWVDIEADRMVLTDRWREIAVSTFSSSLLPTLPSLRS